ncbi:MAG TPA: PQQ-binding-like beta-propeller repeat protein [Fibrobacteria bacterium]|nr:PQQ-binding-like beta-propeller repeat protein [Fibrobacteria bacterium]
MTFAFSPSAAQDRDINYNDEQQAIEAARHLYRVEGDPAGARVRLAFLLEESRNEEVRTQARYLLGRLQEQSGQRDSALAAYRQALAGKGLQLPEKLWLYKRLLSLDPSSIQPLAADMSAKSGPARVFPGKRGKRTLYTLEFRGPPDGQWERPKELGIQDENGDYHPLDIRLTGREEVLDADAEQCLVLDQETRKVRLMPLKGGKGQEVPAGPRVEVGSILAGEPGAFLLVGAGVLRAFRAGKPAWEAPLEQEGCAWSSPPDRSQQGMLQCADNQLFLVDARKKLLKAVSGITDKALQVSWEGEYLAVRYIDRFEIRKGASFEIVKWGLPSMLQEKLILGNGRVYLVTTKGSIKSIMLESGQLEWQRDMLASQVAAFDNVLFATTFAQTVVCLDIRGKPMWTYEYGWDREPAILPNEEWVVLHYGDGKRLKLNRELLRVTGNSDGFKFLEYRGREAEKDWKGALASLGKVLSLEPGNGEAWKFRAAALRNSGAPKPEQVQALVEASRSQDTPNWGNGQVLKGLAAGLGANWVWKRQYGPKFYPNLIPHKDLSFYLENDNQTLVLLNHESGGLVNSFRFSEELDMKVALWKNDTICVSSPSRLYLLSPSLNAGGLGQFPLKNPVCQAQAVNGGLIYSDWYGGLNMIGLPDRTLRWERQLGQSGLYLGKAKNVDYLDVVDLEGNYFAVQPTSGKIAWSLRMPPGTITETFSNKDFIYAGYSQGTLIAIDRARQAIVWSMDFGEQIFSLSGNRDNTLVLTTASKKLVCVQAATGAIQSQVRIQSYLFNRPTVIDHGYWLGTTEPALEKRNFNHELILKYKLPDLPGSPILFGNSIFIGTLDNFILSFPS